MAEFFYMGGYGFYIWSSFGMTVVLAVVEVVGLQRQRQNMLRRLRRMARFDGEVAHEAQA